MKKVLILLFVCPLFFMACKNNSSKTSQPDFLAAVIDTTIDPSTDFFDYAVGNWAKNTPIPGAESSWGIGNLVQEEIYIRLKKISEDIEEDLKSTTISDSFQGKIWRWVKNDWVSEYGEMLTGYEPSEQVLNLVRYCPDELGQTKI